MNFEVIKTGTDFTSKMTKLFPDGDRSGLESLVNYARELDAILGVTHRKVSR